MHSPTLLSRSIVPPLAALIVFGLAACASAPVGPPVDAPRLVVGDRWQYRVTDNLRRGVVSQLDAEVIAISGGSTRIRVSYADTSGRTRGVRPWSSRSSCAWRALRRVSSAWAAAGVTPGFKRPTTSHIDCFSR